MNSCMFAERRVSGPAEQDKHLRPPPAYQLQQHSQHRSGISLRFFTCLQTAMLSQLATAQAENNVALIDAALVAQQCSSITVELINSLNKWSTSGVNHLVYNGTICSQEEIAQIQSMVQSSNVVDNKAYVIANVYSQGVDARSDRML